MKTQKGFTHIAILLTVVVVAAVGFAGWKVYDNKDENSKQKTTDATAQPQSILDKTYTDEIGNYSVKYPSGWKLSTKNSSKGGLTQSCPTSNTTLTSPAGYKLHINGYPEGFYCEGGAGDHGPYPVYVYQSVEAIDEQTKYWDVEKQKTATGEVYLASLVIHNGLKCDYLLNENKESTGKTDCPTLEKLANAKNTKPSYYIGLESARVQDEVDQPTPGSNYEFFNFRITNTSNKNEVSALAKGDSKLLTSADGQTIKEILKTFKFTN